MQLLDRLPAGSRGLLLVLLLRLEERQNRREVTGLRLILFDPSLRGSRLRPPPAGAAGAATAAAGPLLLLREKANLLLYDVDFSLYMHHHIVLGASIVSTADAAAKAVR